MKYFLRLFLNDWAFCQQLRIKKKKLRNTQFFIHEPWVSQTKGDYDVTLKRWGAYNIVDM